MLGIKSCRRKHQKIEQGRDPAHTTQSYQRDCYASNSSAFRSRRLPAFARVCPPKTWTAKSLARRIAWRLTSHH